MARVRFRHSSSGYQAVMKGEGVESDLQRRADAVRGVAAPQFAARYHYGDPPEVIADTYIGQSRAGATIIAVHPESLAIERRHRILGGAIDAARG
ncbi:hypothetical protein F4561_006558 [Lipingzhangella halophila]|uniref:Uncharacterized protein n=1 Tax=Lipingzhangella halophila TaxID=1783352 RepID=A0A7W7RP82_9ACTN|nr:hypothetical protein [Lipingzhangella halophila]MBB4935649.1 hypothetical protein [Lipingzhangella halophila]